ncbi:Putative holliday junction resolvase [gamma proteobacterium HdN1]|nr:Putative holliday junction resolvase [gamma proteobacterium HdN1]
MALTTFLGFDYGTTVIGVAVGQTVTGTASALALLPARDGVPDWLQVELLIQEWQPDAFIVGIPLNMDGTETILAPRARKFGNRLTGRFRKPWFPVDERLSTREAWQALESQHQLHKRALRGNQRVDAVAAALILGSWLESHKDSLPTK